MNHPIPIIPGLLGQSVHHLSGVQLKEKQEINPGGFKILFYSERGTSSVGHGRMEFVTPEFGVEES